jgi:hypothetical protein
MWLAHPTRAQHGHSGDGGIVQTMAVQYMVSHFHFPRVDSVAVRNRTAKYPVESLAVGGIIHHIDTDPSDALDLLVPV